MAVGKKVIRLQVTYDNTTNMRQPPDRPPDDIATWNRMPDQPPGGSRWLTARSLFNPKSKGDMSTSQLCWWMNHQYLKQQTDLFIEEKCNDDDGRERIARWRRGNHEGASSVEDPFSTSNCKRRSRECMYSYNVAGEW
jgi:hypothetical protein